MEGQLHRKRPYCLPDFLAKFDQAQPDLVCRFVNTVWTVSAPSSTHKGCFWPTR